MNTIRRGGPAGEGQLIAWAGTSISAGSYLSGVRTYTWKGAGPVHYDMVYTSNAWGQQEKTYFIDSDDSTTRSSARLYTWRQKLRRVAHPKRFGLVASSFESSRMWTTPNRVTLIDSPKFPLPESPQKNSHFF